MRSKILAIISLVIVTLVISLYFLVTRNIHDYDSCVKAHYSVRLLNCKGCPNYCDTPWGMTYSQEK